MKKISSEWSKFRRTPWELGYQVDGLPWSEESEEVKRCVTKALRLTVELEDLFRPLLEEDGAGV